MVKGVREEGQTTQWTKGKQKKDRQHNGQRGNRRRTDNTMDKGVTEEGQTIQLPNEQKDRQYS